MSSSCASDTPNQRPSVEPSCSIEVEGSRLPLPIWVRAREVAPAVAHAQLREVAIQIAALDGAAHHEVMRAPAVVRAVAVAREGATEVRGGEGGDLIGRAQGSRVASK